MKKYNEKIKVIKMMKTAKILSLAIVVAMVFSGLSALIPLAGAEEIFEPQDMRGVEITSTSLDNNDPYFPGMEDVDFSVTVWNWNVGGFPDVAEDDGDTIIDCEMTIDTNIEDENGNPVSTPFEDFSNNVDTDSQIFNSDWDDFWFSFDIRGDAVPGTYNLSITFVYWNESASFSDDFTIEGNILFDIEYRAQINDVGGLIPGDKNKNVNALLNANNNMPGDEGMVDPILEIDLPSGDFTWYDDTATESSAMYIGTIDSWESENFWYMVSVSPITDSGAYDADYVLTYTTENGVACIEYGEIDFIVGHLAMLEVTVAVDTLAQGTPLATWALTFENVGTVDLLDVKLQLDPASDAFTYMPADHWEDGHTVSYAWLELGNIAVGGTHSETMNVGIDLYIPEGMHKVMFQFWGMYIDPDTDTYKNTAIDWTMSGAEYAPRVNMDGNSFTLDSDTSDVKGPFIWIDVTDTTMDIMLTSTNTLSLGGRIIDNGLELDVMNFGNIDFSNVALTIETNSATSPFLNVVDPESTSSEEAILPGTLTAGNTLTAILMVNLAPGATSGVHSVPVTITGVNMDMGESISTTLDARVTISGVGPKLEITTVAPGEIKNGADFTLTLTIVNNGDDTARNIAIGMPNIGGFAGETNEINGDIRAPTADALPMYIPDLAPGESYDVSIDMKANKDMSSGHVYVMSFATSYTDSFGSSDTVTHGVSLKSTGFGGSTVGMFYYAMIILVLVGSIFLIAYTVIMVKKFKKANPKGGIETETSFAPEESFQSDNVEDTPPPPMD